MIMKSSPDDSIILDEPIDTAGVGCSFTRTLETTVCLSWPYAYRYVTQMLYTLIGSFAALLSCFPELSGLASFLTCK